MKVFLSSVISGFEAYREAAAEAVKALGYQVIRAEDFPASTNSPQVACLSGLREADLVVLMLSQRYGAVQPSGKSATHEEYDEARGRKPLLVFVHEGVELEPKQQAFREAVQRWEGGKLWKAFATPDQLRQRVTEAIHKHTLGQAAGRVDEQELVTRASELAAATTRNGDSRLVLALACGPKQAVMRPKQLHDPSFVRNLHKEAKFGEHPVLDDTAETDITERNGALVFEQRERSLRLDELGSVVVDLPARTRERHGLGWLVEEDLAERAEGGLRFVAKVLAMLDATERLSHVAIVAGLFGSGYMGWKTREQVRRDPNSGTMGMGQEAVTAALRPPLRTREQLRNEAKEIAEDLVHLLHRAHSPSRY